LPEVAAEKKTMTTALTDSIRRSCPDSARLRHTIVAQGALAGSLAALASTAALTFAGRRQAGGAAAPINAVSHWYWGDDAFEQRGVDVPHTAVGYLTHHGAAIFWATLYAALCRKRQSMRTVPGILAGALATSAVACFVDYRLTPRRLMPGYEHHLSRGALAVVYAAFAAGLAAGEFAYRNAHGNTRDPALEGMQQGAPHD
jgi:lysylphosphatidylglycerol synthetase-like protein (DUF2156 family)